MARVLCNVMTSDWSVNFIAPDGRTRIGPWLLLDSPDEVRAILRWGNIADEELAEHESSIRRWGVSSAVLNLTDRQLAALIQRGRGWPWNGYELRLMKEAGKYPPAPLVTRKTALAADTGSQKPMRKPRVSDEGRSFSIISAAPYSLPD
jgi:hypothetical protein